MAPIPANVKAILSTLPTDQMIVLKGYIAGLRDENKELKAAADTGDAEMAHEHVHTEHCSHDHASEHKEVGWVPLFSFSAPFIFLSPSHFLFLLLLLL
jgi:hypothetical protein